uniref:Putative ovule protein n=1 Tax=Solanum chacoense TaxID=4108 RepID=A0A0V0H7E2_SOLCH
MEKEKKSKNNFKTYFYSYIVSIYFLKKGQNVFKLCEMNKSALRLYLEVCKFLVPTWKGYVSTVLPA